MKEFAKKEYWDSVYQNMGRDGGPESFWGALKKSIKNNSRDYSNYLMWGILIPKFLPKNKDVKIIEIGCAPGKYLINFNKIFGYEPHGIEYTTSGVNITRQNFIKAGLKPENIISGDFFDNDFQNEYKESFGVVFSRGFIEHYEDVKSVVEKHLNLLMRGGYLVISIPNLSGINGVISKILNVDSFLLHNTSIMDITKFEKLFDFNDLEKLYCDYVGVFSFGLFNTNSRSKYYFYRIMLLVQRPLDWLLRVLFKDNLFKSKYTSPYLLYIGKKK